MFSPEPFLKLYIIGSKKFKPTHLAIDELSTIDELALDDHDREKTNKTASSIANVHGNLVEEKEEIPFPNSSRSSVASEADADDVFVQVECRVPGTS